MSRRVKHFDERAARWPAYETVNCLSPVLRNPFRQGKPPQWGGYLNVTKKVSILLRLAYAIFLIAACLAGAEDSPGHIRLSSSVAVHGKADEALEYSFIIANHGTESAHRLRIATEFAGIDQPGDEPEHDIPAGGELRLAGRLSTPEILRPGEYPLIFRIDYDDSSGYPFSAVSATVVTNLLPPEALATPFRLRINPPDQLKTQDRLRLLFFSRHAEPLRARARLILPSNLTAVETEKVFDIPAESARSVNFTIQNLNGRAGSRLAMAAVIAYELDSIPRCVVGAGMIEIPAHRGYAARLPMLWVAIAGLLLLLFIACQWPETAKRMPGFMQWMGNGWVIGFFVVLLLTAHIPPALLLSDTLTVGGDTPAHNYLASHLRSHWFGEGRLLTWSHAWWCGFPAFQFYFPLPYMLIAAASIVLPFNIAFKLVSVLGVAALPFTTYLSARIMKLPKTAAALMSAAVLPFLFTDAHVMWGVNLYSTLAGMIANSISFALLPLCLACAWRDSASGRPRLHSILLLTALMLSHFFTSVIVALTIAGMPFMQPRSGVRRAFRALAVDGVATFFLCAWWLLPLFGKREFSVDFGQNWDETLWGSLPLSAYLAVLPAAAAVATALRKRGYPAWPWIWMTISAATLFVIGTGLHPVFVNVRLWPFVYFGVLMLGAIGAGHYIGLLRCPYFAVMAAFLLIAVSIDNTAPLVRSWAEWNLEGLEAKPLGNEFKKLIEPLDGTPGRLAYDLNDANKAFGSSRIFEAVPHLIDKPILEGGLVNSALGALFAYTVQGEISERGAGYPTIVPPSEFNPCLGLRHLELFGVRHLITAWPPLIQALSDSPSWQTAHQVDRWQVFAATLENYGMIGVLDRIPDTVITSERQRAAVAWTRNPDLLDRPLVFSRPGQTVLESSGAFTSMEYESLLDGKPAATNSIPELFRFDSTPVTIKEWSNHRIRFNTTAVGRPHMIKVSYFPNWKVNGAPSVHMVSPAFMLVVPDDESVELTYGFTFADRLGHIVTAAGLILMFGWLFTRLKPSRD